MKTRTNLLLGLILTVSIFTYLSCKKTDIKTESEVANISLTEQKFFNTHRTTDPTEKALVNFLKKINEKDKFIEQTVSQIGFPRWDKTISSNQEKINQNSINILGDSIQTFYIPFVRDSQNYVNASMVINVSPTDTSFSYRCDWQYEQYVNDSATVNDQGKNVAAFFMALDNVVFGHTQFKINDKRLFKPLSNIHANDTGDYIIKKVFLSDSINSLISNNLLAYECTDIVIFYECSICHGNDPDCPLGGTWYEYYRFCDWTYYPDPDNNGGGTGGTGGGGGGGGGSTPPNCDQQPVPFAKGLHNQSNFVNPCGGGGGWTPIPIEDEPIPTISVYSITNTINPNFPCLRAAFDDVTAPRLRNCIYNLYNETFVGTNKVHNLEILSRPELLDDNGSPVPAKSRVKPNDNNTYQIALNEYMGLNFTKEYWSSVILHELVHGFIQKNALDFTPSSQFQNIHQIMLTTWVGDIKEALLDIYPSMSMQDALCLAINGMSDMLTGDVNNTFKYEMTLWMEQYYNVNSTMLGQVADAYSNGTKGTPCN